MSGLEEKNLLRRVVEICATLETGKWNGYASTDMIEDEELDLLSLQTSLRQRTTSSCSSECSTPTATKRARKKPSGIIKWNSTSVSKLSKSGNLAGGTANITNIGSLDLADLEKEKMRSLMQQSFFNSLLKVLFKLILLI